MVPPREYGKARKRAFIAALLLLFPLLFPVWYSFVFRLCYKAVQRDKTIGKRVRSPFALRSALALVWKKKPRNSMLSASFCETFLGTWYVGVRA